VDIAVMHTEHYVFVGSDHTSSQPVVFCLCMLWSLSCRKHNIGVVFYV